MLLTQGPPTDKQRVPNQVWEPLQQVFSWFLWFGIVLSVASFVATIGMLAHQRRSASSTSLLEEATLIRICVASAVLGSSASIANALLV